MFEGSRFAFSLRFLASLSRKLIPRSYVINNIIFGEPWNKFTRKWCKTVGLCS